MIGGDIVVDGVVDIAEMLLTLWEDGSFEKTWLSEWVSDWLTEWKSNYLVGYRLQKHLDKIELL